MAGTFFRTKPSFLEAGLPCASLSAECQRDNNARQRPPQNRLHIWWARRPPTISRAALLAALLPYDLHIEESMLQPLIPEPELTVLDNLQPKLKSNQDFYRKLLQSVRPTALPTAHIQFLRSLGVRGDAAAAYNRMSLRDELSAGGPKVVLPDALTYRHPPAISVGPSNELLLALRREAESLLGVPEDQPVVVLDFMAGGGVIPLEGVRYGMKVFANDLNPVAALILQATVHYPARFGGALSLYLWTKAREISSAVRARLGHLFTTERESRWWNALDKVELERFRSKQVEKLEPCGDAVTLDYLWLRTVPCSNCHLNIPISTNFHIVNRKGKPEAAIAAFPEVPPEGRGNDCTFRIVKRNEWKHCRWPKPGFDGWHPRNTPTFKGGDALCPRCGNVVDGEEVKAIARNRPGGLPARMYAVCSQVPAKLTYKNGDEKVRYLWRFRAPSTADIEACQAAEKELARLLPGWEAEGLVPDEEIPEDMEDKRPREYGMPRWRDLFLPRQLLTNLTVLEEIRRAQARARRELPPDEAEAVGVYLAFILSKVVNYNSVNTFWHYGRHTVTQTFSRHDFAFRPCFCEFEGARETVLWGASQVIGAYEALAALIHGEPVNLEEGGGDDEASDMAEEGGNGTEFAEDDEGEEETEESPAADTPTPSGNPYHVRPEVIVPTVTCEDAAALSVPAPGTVHLICVDPPYYNNVQYAELSNFFYVWLKRALRDYPGLAHLFREPLAESNREAVANAARWARQAQMDQGAWKARYDEAYEALRARKVKVKEARERALEAAGPKPASAKERADRFYEDKMAAVFRRARQLLHPAGRMVVMFNHKQTWAWRALGMALIRAGFEVRSSVPIHTEAESSLNIRGLDAAKSTILLLCVPREEKEQLVGNWANVQAGVAEVARNAANHFHQQGIAGTDLYLSALGPALGEVARHWPVTDFAGREVELADALEQSYRSVGHWRLKELLREMSSGAAELTDRCEGFSAEAADRDSQALWLWLDTFEGEKAGSDEVRKLARSLNVDPADFQRMGLVDAEKEVFTLRTPQETDLRLLSLRLKREPVARGRASRAADVWEERTFPGFLGAAVWNAVGLMAGEGAAGPSGPDALRRWLDESGYGQQRDFFGAFAVTLYLLERVFRGRREGDLWDDTARHARRAWDLVIKDWRV